MQEKIKQIATNIKNFIKRRKFFIKKPNPQAINFLTKRNKLFVGGIASSIIIVTILILISNLDLAGGDSGDSPANSSALDSTSDSSSQPDELDISSQTNISQQTIISQASSNIPSKDSISENAENGDVKIPANFTAEKIKIPEGFLTVPSSQKALWMSSLTLFQQSQDCTMFLWINTSTLSCMVKNNLFEITLVSSSSNTIISNAAILIALNKADGKSQTEILHVDLKKNDDAWELSPVKNIQKANLPITQQLRVVSPKSPLTKLQVNDTSKLITFNPASFGAVGKSPFRLREVTIASVIAMLGQARNEGIADITIRDTYRGYEQQSSMFQAVINYYKRTGLSSEMAYKRAETETAIPGTSEHHDGFTTDVITKNVSMNQNFGKTQFGKWLAGNCWNYGFIIRYLADKESQTTKKYEPWHVRYVGIPTSLLFQKYGIVLEEFHSYLTQNQYLMWSCKDNNQADPAPESDFIYIQCSTSNDLILPIDIINTLPISYPGLSSKSDSNPLSSGISQGDSSNYFSHSVASFNPVISGSFPLSSPSAILSDDGAGKIVVIFKLR